MEHPSITFAGFREQTQNPQRNSSLNCKNSFTQAGETINQQLKGHATQIENWLYGELVQILHQWAQTFNEEFRLELPIAAIQVEKIGAARLGTYRNDRNGFGVLHQVTLNASYVDRSLGEILCTLLHELLHQWQRLFGKAGRAPYHNRQFRQKASLYGLIIDRRGHTWVEPGRFTALLSKYGVDIRSLRTPEEKPLPERHIGNSKMQKYRCGCTTVRCATLLQAHCEKCGLPFREAPPSW